jgi:hypothetical protein
MKNGLVECQQQCTMVATFLTPLQKNFINIDSNNQFGECKEWIVGPVFSVQVIIISSNSIINNLFLLISCYILKK